MHLFLSDLYMLFSGSFLNKNTKWHARLDYVIFLVVTLHPRKEILFLALFVFAYVANFFNFCLFYRCNVFYNVASQITTSQLDAQSKKRCTLCENTDNKTDSWQKCVRGDQMFISQLLIDSNDIHICTIKLTVCFPAFIKLFFYFSILKTLIIHCYVNCLTSFKNNNS